MTTEGNAALVRRLEGSTRATLLELLFDVVFVAALALTSTLLTEELSWSGGAKVLLMLTAIWWTWSLTATTTEFYDPQQRPIQAILMIAMVGSVGMAAALPMVTIGHLLLFVISYVGTHLIRCVILVAALHRQGHQTARERATRFLFWFTVSGVFWVTGALSETPNWGLWTIAITIDLVAAAARYPTPWLGRVPARPVHADHRAPGRAVPAVRHPGPRRHHPVADSAGQPGPPRLSPARRPALRVRHHAAALADLRLPGRRVVAGGRVQGGPAGAAGSVQPSGATGRRGRHGGLVRHGRRPADRNDSGAVARADHRRPDAVRARPRPVRPAVSWACRGGEWPGSSCHCWCCRGPAAGHRCWSPRSWRSGWPVTSWSRAPTGRPRRGCDCGEPNTTSGEVSAGLRGGPGHHVSLLPEIRRAGIVDPGRVAPVPPMILGDTAGGRA